MDDEKYMRLLAGFLSGKTTAAEIRELRRLTDHGPEGDFDALCRKIWGAGQEEIPEEKKERMKAGILARIRQFEEKRRTGRKRRLRVVGGAVAIAASLAVAAVAGYTLAGSRRPEQQYELFCDNGQKAVLTLPDGTVVRLNSSSRLRYDASYNEDSRNIRLSGEAYFEVARNEDRPFVVEAGEMKVKVLGTRFNLKAYDGEDRIEATLIEGKIVAAVGEVEEVLLPAERLSYHKSAGRLVKTRGLDTGRLAPWLHDEVYFSHTTLAEVARILERTYNVRVRFQDERLAACSYTGHIRNCSLKNILNLIVSTSPVKYSYEGNEILFHD